MAPSRRSNRAKNTKLTSNDSTSVDSKFLCLEDVTCKICLELMIEPVSLPCSHKLCFPCYESCVQKANLCCPMCRKRISVWCRQATKNNSVVDKELWERIKTEFPDQVKLRCEGSSNVQEPDEFSSVVPMHQFAEPGEILKEFEAEHHKLSHEEEQRRKEEEKASADLIAQLQQEEADNRAIEQERIRLEDEALARSLASERESRVLRPSTVIQTPPSSRKRPRKPSDAATPAPKRTINSFFSSRPSSEETSVSQSSPQSNESTSQCSVTSSKSIERELSKRLHFRPINAAPLTPPKHSPDSGQIIKPLVITGTVRDLNKLYDNENQADVNQNHACNTVKEGGLAEELLAMEREWLRRKMEQEEVDREFARQLQEQLNRESNIPSVNRTKGSNDEYKLRSKSGKQTSIEDSFQRRPLRKSSP